MNRNHSERAAAPVISMLITAILFSTGGAAIKLTSVGAWQVAGSRSLIAAMCLWLLIPGARRQWSKKTWALGIAYAATVALFVHANKLTTAASTIFLQGAAPLYVVVLGPLLLKEPLRRRDLVLAPILALGLGLFFLGADTESATAPDPPLGNLLAFISGVCYALVILGLRSARRGAVASGRSSQSEPGAQGTSQAAAAVICGNLIVAITCLPAALPLTPMEALDVSILLYLGIFQIALAYLLMVHAIGRLTALEASLLLLLEPALSPLWAFWLVGELPGVWTWAGGALLIGGTVFHAVGAYRR